MYEAVRPDEADAFKMFFSFNAVDGNRDHDQNKHKYLIFENSKYRIHILVVKRPPTHGLRSDSERIG